MFPLPLTLENLTLPKEKTYYQWALVISIVAWLAVLISVVGLFIAPVAGLVLWMLNGLLVARLRSEGVLVGADQLPELNAVHLEVCQKLGLATPPELYVLESHGVLNAFATRHSGRDFVVIYSSLLEAFGPTSPEIRFLIGHEIGHIRQKHLFKRMLLFPGLSLPLLGQAYSRACEASCDRHGAYAAGDIDGAIRAMMTLSGGKAAARVMNPEEFSGQYFRHRGFFVSWHELISDYPTLSQRVSNLLAIKTEHFRPGPGRHPLAYFFGLFSLRSLLTVYIVVVILTALALPAITAAEKKARALKEKSEQGESSDLPEPKPSAETTLIPDTTQTPPIPPAPPADTPAPAPETPPATDAKPAEATPIPAN